MRVKGKDRNMKERMNRNRRVRDEKDGKGEDRTSRIRRRRG
jgi:hypothetical protein